MPSVPRKPDNYDTDDDSSSQLLAEGPFFDAEPLNEHLYINEIVERLYEEKCFSDVTILVGDKEIKCHKAVLAMQSPVFQQMFASNPEMKELTLHKRAITFDIFIHWLYSCRLDVSEFDLDTVLDLLLIANNYQVEKLQNGLMEVLKVRIDMDNVFKIFATCYKMEGPNSLKQFCLEFMCENATEVIKNFEFLSLPKQALIDMVSDQEFMAPEIDILMVISTWQRVNDNTDVKDILKHVRLPLVKLDGSSMVQVAPVYEMLRNNGYDLARIGAPDDSVKGRGRDESMFCVYITLVIMLICCFNNITATINIASVKNGAKVELVEGGRRSHKSMKTIFEKRDKGKWLYDSVTLHVSLRKTFLLSSMSFSIHDKDQPLKLDISGSSDGENWTKLCNGEFVKINSDFLFRGSSNMVSDYVLLFPAMDIRYSNIYFPSNAQFI